MTTTARYTRAPLRVLIGVWMFAVAQLAHADSVRPAVTCRAQLQVWLSPEVDDPRSPGFLSSLANTPGYVLTWLGASDADMSVSLELSGPGPSYLCREEVERLRRDARVLDIKVLGASFDLN